MIRLTRELDQLNKRVIKIEYEIIQGERGNVEEESARRRRSTATWSSAGAEEIRAERRAHRVAVHRRVLAR